MFNDREGGAVPLTHGVAFTLFTLLHSTPVFKDDQRGSGEGEDQATAGGSAPVKLGTSSPSDV